MLRSAPQNPVACLVTNAMRACEVWMQQALALLDQPAARRIVATATGAAPPSSPAMADAPPVPPASGPSKGRAVASGASAAANAGGPLGGVETKALSLAASAANLLADCANLPVKVLEKESFAPADPSAMLLLLRALL